VDIIDIDRRAYEKDCKVLELIKSGEIWIDLINLVVYSYSQKLGWQRLKGWYDKKGYITVDIQRNKEKIRMRKNRLVWIYYYRKVPPLGYLVHHIDENKTNNDIRNLELRTKANHLIHGGMYPMQRLTPSQILEIIRRYEKVKGKKGWYRKGEVESIAKEFGIHRSHIPRIYRKYKQNKEDQADL